MTNRQVRLRIATMELQTDMLTSNLIDRYPPVKLTSKWYLFPDGTIKDCHGKEFPYDEWSDGSGYKMFYSKETGYVYVYRLVTKNFNLLRCDRNAIHHNTFNKKCDGVEELTVLTPAEHGREHYGSKFRNKS